MHRRNIDVGCVQETRWKGESTRKIGSEGCRYKLFWKGCKEGTEGVGVYVAEKWWDSVLQVNRVSERIMVLKMKLGVRLTNILSVYAPQAGREDSKRMRFGQRSCRSYWIYRVERQ